MKKIFKLTGVLLALAMLIGLSSCADLLGVGLGGTEKKTSQQKQTTQDYSKPINHEFYKDNTTVGISFFYYNSTQKFSYTGHDACYYQISFNAGKKTWSMFTRTTSSTDKIEDVAWGSYTGDPSKEGTLVLTSTDGQTASQTVTIKKDAAGNLYFVGDVAAAHKYISATDAK